MFKMISLFTYYCVRLTGALRRQMVEGDNEEQLSASDTSIGNMNSGNNNNSQIS
jgi:hypothetical protein